MKHFLTETRTCPECVEDFAGLLAFNEHRYATYHSLDHRKLGCQWNKADAEKAITEDKKRMLEYIVRRYKE